MDGDDDPAKDLFQEYQVEDQNCLDHTPHLPMIEFDAGLVAAGPAVGMSVDVHAAGDTDCPKVALV